jgi:membrane protein YdbS with pleckstrin-like domain
MANVSPNSFEPTDRVTPTGDEETVYFQGSPMLRGELMQTTLYAIAGLLVAAAPALLWLFASREWHIWWLWPISIGLGLTLFLIPVMITKRIKYRISNYRIDREIGILSKKIDTLELWHVEDIEFFQSLTDRLLGVGTITVISHDDTTPRLDLKSLPRPRPIFEALKNRIIAVKRQRGVIKLDGGGIADHSPG